MHSSPDFVLRGGDAAFANRQKLLFDQLSIAESKYNKTDKPEIVDDDAEMDTDVYQCKVPTTSRVNLKRKRETKKFCGKESIFKRPEAPAPRASCRTIPDYHKNPHKWTKYSLDDVSNEDMTERSNTQAAMSFLKELKARKKRGKTDTEKMDVEPCKSNLQHCTKIKFKPKHMSKSQITFRKPEIKEVVADSEGIVETEEKPIFRSSKIILPEYIIGQKLKKLHKQKQPIIKVDRSQELRLDHLQEADEEEDN